MKRLSLLLVLLSLTGCDAYQQSNNINNPTPVGYVGSHSVPSVVPDISETHYDSMSGPQSAPEASNRQHYTPREAGNPQTAQSTGIGETSPGS